MRTRKRNGRDKQRGENRIIPSVSSPFYFSPSVSSLFYFSPSVSSLFYFSWNRPAMNSSFHCLYTAIQLPQFHVVVSNYLNSYSTWLWDWGVIQNMRNRILIYGWIIHFISFVLIILKVNNQYVDNSKLVSWISWSLIWSKSLKVKDRFARQVHGESNQNVTIK